MFATYLVSTELGFDKTLDCADELDEALCCADDPFELDEGLDCANDACDEGLDCSVSPKEVDEGSDCLSFDILSRFLSLRCWARSSAERPLKM